MPSKMGMLAIVLAAVASICHPQLTIDLKRVDNLILQLDSNSFADRQAAQTELQDRATQTLENARFIEERLRAALADRPPLELRRRIEQILQVILAFGPHYKCFDISPSGIESTDIKMTTQFKFAMDVGIAGLNDHRLCAPALKLPVNTIPNPPTAEQMNQLRKLEMLTPHLRAVYAQSNEDVDRKVNLETQAGTGTDFELLGLRFIFTPVLKRTPPAVARVEDVPPDPHYLCWSVASKEPELEQRYDLLTQFGREADRDLMGPAILCAPALKNPGPADTEEQQDRQRRLLRQLESKFPHLACFRLSEGQSPAVRVNLTTQFGQETGDQFRGLNVGAADLLCMPARKTAATASGTGALELDRFPDSRAQFVINTPFGSDTVNVRGPAAVLVDLLTLDADRNGRDEVRSKLFQMELTGTSSLLGPLVVRLRSPDKSPFESSIGEIQESTNLATGRLDLPPFAPTGSATSFFDVFFEVELLSPPPNVPAQLRLLHNEAPKKISATINHKPPVAGTMYTGTQPVSLLDEAGNLTGVTVSASTHTFGRILCDANGDSEVDVRDIQAIFSLRNTTAAVNDPFDADGDGLITSNDARICANRCLRADCAK